MKTKKLYLVAVILLAFVLSFSACAPADETAAEFYQGKTLVFRNSGSPGGGYDRWSRAIAPYLEKYTGATVIVENLPGAGDLLSPNVTYTAAPDGLVVDLVNGMAAGLGIVSDNPAVRFEMAKFTHLGRVTQDPFFIVVAADSRFQSLDDIATKATPDNPYKIGDEAVGGSPSASSCVAAYALGWQNAKVVAGYAGTAEINLAVLKGEVDALGCSTASAVKWTTPGDLKALVCFDYERDPNMSDTPTIFELATIPADKKWIMDAYIAIQQGGRLIVTTPGIPEDRAEFLNNALKNVLQDQEFQATLKKGMVVKYLDGPKTAELYTNLEELLKGENKNIFKQVLLEMYVD